MSVRNLYRLNTDGSCKVDLEELLNDESSSFSNFSDKYKEYLYNDFINESEIRRYLKSNKEETVPINEATRKELLNLAEYKRKLRAKKLVTHYKGVTTKRGWIKFETNSQYTPGLKYIEYVKLAEDKSMKYFRNYKPREIINLFLSGDIQVYCSCPDFLYKGYKYMAYQMGYGMYKENRFPKIRNPRLEGSICKHLILVLQVIGFNYTRIAKDMVRTKYYKNKMSDDSDMDTNIKKWKNSGKNKNSKLFKKEK